MEEDNTESLWGGYSSVETDHEDNNHPEDEYAAKKWNLAEPDK